MPYDLIQLNALREKVGQQAECALARAEKACAVADKLVQKNLHIQNKSRIKDPIVSIRVQSGRLVVKVFSLSKGFELDSADANVR